MSGSTVGYVPIVQVNVSQQVGPTPSTLQRTGAFVSQGATTQAPGAFSLLTQLSSLTPLLKGALAITGITQTSGTATATTTAAHGFTTSDTILLTIAGAGQSAYNGTFLCTITGASAFTYPVPSGTTSPATGTIVYTPEDVAELVQMATTFFAQGNAVAVYVLELGAGNAVDGLVALTALITANPNIFYSYLLPHTWGVEPTFYSSFAKNFTSPTAKTYFHATTTLAYWQANPTVFAKTLKSVVVTIEAPAVAAAAALGTPTEFSAAAGFYVTLNLNPSPSNQVTQAAYSFLYGVTAYPITGMAATFTTMAAANINIIGTGAEGGISNTVWLYGTTLDGADFNKYWYSVDNVQITLDRNTSNAVINGSNNPLAPLNYNQAGINTLQGVAMSVMQTEIAVGLALGTLTHTQLIGTEFSAAIEAGQFANQVVVNAVPFSSYATLEPGDYSIGKYAGLSVAYTVQLGFRQIIYNVVVANFV
jgi:hypothetical protein